MSDGGWDLTGIPRPFWPYVFEVMERLNPRAFKSISVQMIAALGIAEGPFPEPWKVSDSMVGGPQPIPWKDVAETLVGSVALHYVALHTDDQAMRERMQKTALARIEESMRALRNLDAVYERTVMAE